MLSHSPLELHPHSESELLLTRASQLARHGFYGEAKQLAAAVLMHSQIKGYSDLTVRCLLVMADLEGMVQRPVRAVELVQQAQALGGPMELWVEMICSYATHRCVNLNALLFSTLNEIICGYFDPENIFLDNEHK